MGYSDAPIEQARLVEYWQSPVGIGHGKYITGWLQEQRLRQTGEVGVRRIGFCQEMIHELIHGIPYWVSDPACAFLNAAVGSFPLATLTGEMVPDRFGFVYFATPLSLPLDSDDGDDGVPVKDRKLRAFTWERVGMTSGAVLRYRADSAGPPDGLGGIAITSYEEREGQRNLRLTYTIQWEFGASWERGVGMGVAGDIDAAAHAARVATGRHLGQFWHFLRQRQVVIPAQSVTNGAARKKIARTMPYVRDVRMVELDHELDQRNLGHWRNQYYRSTGEHRPLLVAPRAHDRT